MIALQEKLIRCLVAAQEATLEWGDTFTDDEANRSIALAALEENLKEASKLARKLRDE